MSLGIIPFSEIFLTVLFDTLTNNVLFLFLFLIKHLFKCVAVIILRFSNPEAFPFLSAFIIPRGVMVNYGDLQFAERIMVARRSEMSAEWKVRFTIFERHLGES
jgi:hypothetical protein